ncbi:MAG TPA: pilus assembly protein TadG-related protein [Candidatus Binatia bacterium]|nr:pilus assembly protein TadG-related protein [Candidatus Binatia bacterium]
MLTCRELSSSSPSFARARGGNVAMMWALMGAVLVGLIGITVDFTRAQMIRTQMQNAVDGAALVAERSSNLSIEQRRAAARAFFDAEMGDMAANITSFEVIEQDDGGHRVDVQMPMPVSLARIVNDDDWNLHVDAVAQMAASPPIEVALVLDNTGSMSADMPALRDAASDLVADLLEIDGDTVRVALVPFVAQVNIGNDASHLAWMDTTGVAPMNGEILEDRMIGYVPRNNNSSSRAYTGPTCNALSTLPYFNNTGTATNEGYTGPYRVIWQRGVGLGQTGYCFAFTPADGINYFTLFDLISNEDWKGCVEARPPPYDINDAAPNIGTPATLFVPFFWLDTGGAAGQGSTNTSSAANYQNNNNSFIDDTPGDLRTARASNVSASGSASNANIITTFRMSSGTAPLVGSPTAQEEREARFFNVFKYNGGSASLDTTGPDTRTPNRGCPTPIVPLTSNESVLQANVAAMRHWMGGGTNQAEGLAWGWRVLTPTAPFTEGEAFNAAHDNVRKVIVLMSDGENTNVGSDAVMDSDFSAYNYLGFWTDYAEGVSLTQLLFGVLHGILPNTFRRDIDSRSEFVDYVNDRQEALCNAIKADDIEIYVVRFRDGDADLMRDCATSPSHYFEADNASQLAAAFAAIGSGIGQLRLTD